MIFQTLDDKAECVGIYAENKLVFDEAEFPDGLTATWDIGSYDDPNVMCASLFLEGAPLEDVLPEYLIDDWHDTKKRLAAFRRSLEISKVVAEDVCFFDLVPQRFLVEYCEIKNRMTKHVIDNVSRPRRYNFYHWVGRLLSEISHRPVKLDIRRLKSVALSENKSLSSVCDAMVKNPYVRYNQFGTKTGRLSTKPQSFPILTLNKKLRPAIVPVNDFFVELDFNGAEVRTLLGLLEQKQPFEDVHEFHLEKIFTELQTRSDAKTAFFAWLYGSKSAASSAAGKELEKFYDKDKILEKHWVDGCVTTPYGKEIPQTTQHYALNYLVQSTTAELCLKQFLKINYLLQREGSGSNISFIIHDAVVLDMKKEDEHLLTKISSLMRSTNFGNFRINIKKGNSLGSLKEIRVG